MLSVVLALLTLHLQNHALLPTSGFASKVWSAYEGGFQAEKQTRGGHAVIRCVASDTSKRFGASATIQVRQSSPKTLAISGWSKAIGVGGIEDSDYALYADIHYDDGTWDYGISRGFATGNHGWQQRLLTFSPRRGIDTINLYALFRNHKGTALFSDFQISELDTKDLFDSQVTQWMGPAAPVSPTLYVRDLANPAKIWPLAGMRGKSAELSLIWNGGQIQDTSGKDRALTLYFVFPFDATGGFWHRDIRHKQPIQASGEYSNFVNVPVGVVSAISQYPFACVTNSTGGLVIGSSMSAPSVCRLFYNASKKLLVGAWDVAFTKGHRSALIGVWVDNLTAAEKDWGFRAATKKFYNENAEAVRRRTAHDGIWMPFTDPSKVENQADFGIVYHEGDNSIVSDHKLHIESYRYSEPSSFWMAMAKSEPRTYENALRILHQRAKNGPQRDEARATEACALRGPDGRIQLEFRNEPWCDGALFVLDPNPALPAQPGYPTKGSIEMKDVAWSGSRVDSPDGLYLDSLESWCDHLDYDQKHWAVSSVPLTFDADARPVLPQWFSTFALEQAMAHALHAQGRLLMANTVPVRFSIFTANLDIMGIEVNWLGEGGSWQPDSDETFNLRRTLAFQRPYLLLQNTDYHRFGPEQVEKYLEKCAFYDVFPSMFSANAATNVYWEDPALYNRDRARFKEWIPLIKRLSSDGWEPITYAKTDDIKVYVERYGNHYLAFFNDSPVTRTCSVTIDTTSLQLPRNASVLDRSGQKIKLQDGKAELKIGPERCEIWTIRR